MKEPEVERPRDAVLTPAAEGFRLPFRHALLRGSLLCTSTINFFNFFWLAIFVLYATRELGLSPGTIGIVLGVGAVGALSAPSSRRGSGGGSGSAARSIVGAMLFPVADGAVPARVRLARGW